MSTTDNSDATVNSSSLDGISTTSLATSSTCDQPFRFLDLPAELRCQIYEYFVIVGKEFYIPDHYAVNNEKRFKDWRAYRVPELTLLRVSKQVHDEAEKLYLSNNLFVLPDFLASPLFSEAAGNLLKNISISFSPRVLTPELMDHFRWAYREQFNPPWAFDALDTQERLQSAHDYSQMSLIKYWDDEIHCLLDFLPGFPNRLRYVEVDVTNAYCPIGCCRLIWGPCVKMLFVQ